MTDRDEFVSASDLARMGYCERQVAFDACHGRRVTVEQERARDRGLKAHAAFYDESRRIAAASATKGRCFIATLALGECDDTRVLRAFRDLYLRRSAGSARQPRHPWSRPTFRTTAAPAARASPFSSQRRVRTARGRVSSQQHSAGEVA